MNSLVSSKSITTPAFAMRPDQFEDSDFRNDRTPNSPEQNQSPGSLDNNKDCSEDRQSEERVEQVSNIAENHSPIPKQNESDESAERKEPVLPPHPAIQSAPPGSHDVS